MQCIGRFIRVLSINWVDWAHLFTHSCLIGCQLKWTTYGNSGGNNISHHRFDHHRTCKQPYEFVLHLFPLFIYPTHTQSRAMQSRKIHNLDFHLELHVDVELAGQKRGQKGSLCTVTHNGMTRIMANTNRSHSSSTGFFVRIHTILNPLDIAYYRKSTQIVHLIQCDWTHDELLDFAYFGIPMGRRLSSCGCLMHFLYYCVVFSCGCQVYWVIFDRIILIQHWNIGEKCRRGHNAYEAVDFKWYFCFQLLTTINHSFAYDTRLP